MSTNVGAIESSSDVVVSSEPPSNSNIAVSSGVMAVVGAESLDSKTETLATEPFARGATVEGLVDDARVPGGEIGVVLDKDEKPLDDSSLDAVVSSVPPDAMNKIGVDLLESKSGTLIMGTSDHDGGGDVVQGSIDDAKVSRDGLGIVENSELVQDLVGDARVSGDETGVRMDNGEININGSSSDAIVSSVSPVIGPDLLESKTGTLATETSDDDGGADIVAQDSVDDARVSRDGTGTVIKNSELVLDKPTSEAVISSLPLNNRDIGTIIGIKIGADSLGSETETLKMEPSEDQNGGGDFAVQGLNDDSGVSGNEKGIVVENIKKASDENEANNEEKEGEYKVTDIVWAKVKNYPWWPGQIFDSSSSTDKAKKYSNKKGYFIGYFGDQTFAWNKASKIKPFRKSFSKLEKQSNSKAFLHAVDCALDEVTRRVDFGLLCSCISKEVRDKVKSQVFVNSGIREEASKIDGGDRFSTVSTFKPVKAVQTLQELAREHFDGFNRLEVLSVRTQLLAFFRWKGYYQLQAHNIVDALDNKLEDESDFPIMEEDKVVEDEKPASVGKKVSSKKRKPDICDGDDSVPHKKEKSLTNMISKCNSSIKSSKKTTSKTATPDDNVFKEENGNGKLASAGKKVSSKKRKPNVCDSDDSVPRKKEKSLMNMTQKGNSSVKSSKKTTSKKATPDDNVFKEENGNGKPASAGKNVSSKKRKPDVCEGDDSLPHKKEKSLTNMTPKSNSSVKRSKKIINKKATAENYVSKEENGNGSDEEKSSIASPKRLFRVGDSICRIAKQISESPLILKKESQKSKDDESPNLDG